MRNVKGNSIPINRDDPVDCRGGWFYVNQNSIDIVTDAGDIARLTRKQALAALKVMDQRKPP